MDHHLKEIRLSLVEKASVFRKMIRKPPNEHRRNVADSTRGLEILRGVNEHLSLEVQRYMSNRDVMSLALWTSEEASRYKEIQPKDLNVNTAALNLADTHSWTSDLPWFWKMDISGDMNADEYLAECKYMSTPP